VLGIGQIFWLMWYGLGFCWKERLGFVVPLIVVVGFHKQVGIPDCGLSVVLGRVWNLSWQIELCLLLLLGY
jgi:hypothetical protein